MPEPTQLEFAARLLHEIDHLVSRPGPLSDISVLLKLITRRTTEAALEFGGDASDYRQAWVEFANQAGWDLSTDEANWAEMWRAIQASGRRRARWEEFQDALEDLD